jgi:hypothetical protein
MVYRTSHVLLIGGYILPVLHLQRLPTAGIRGMGDDIDLGGLLIVVVFQGILFGPLSWRDLRLISNATLRGDVQS